MKHPFLLLSLLFVVTVTASTPSPSSQSRQGRLTFSRQPNSAHDTSVNNITTASVEANATSTNSRRGIFNRKTNTKLKKKNEQNETAGDVANDTPRRRGPFGFFKPLDEVKKGKESTLERAKEPEDEKASQSVAENQGNSTSLGQNATHLQSDQEELAPNKSEADAKAQPPINASHPETMRPRYIVMGAPGMVGQPPSGSRPVPGAPYGRPHQISPEHRQALMVGTVSGIINSAFRLWFLIWLVKKVSSEDELISPRQHFRWECLNDRYTRDGAVLNNIMAIPPRGFSRFHWKKYLKQRKPKKTRDLAAAKGPKLPTKSVFVVDITPAGNVEMSHLTHVVNFLVSSHIEGQLGENPEIVLLLESPGGGASFFGLAAAQIGRLKQLGLNVTICVDAVAASGGYMIASQATKLVAAPFAMLGSIGVITEGVNFNELLKKYGVKPLVLKAGVQKNRLSTIGAVSDEDLKEESKRLENIHKAFIDMCLSERPMLDPAVCDGTVMLASEGREYGIVDEVLTSQEYLWRCIQEGAHVLKLHKASDRNPNFALFQALNLLPHLKQQPWGNNIITQLQERLRNVDTNQLVSGILKWYAVASMASRTFR